MSNNETKRGRAWVTTQRSYCSKTVTRFLGLFPTIEAAGAAVDAEVKKLEAECVPDYCDGEYVSQRVYYRVSSEFTSAISVAEAEAFEETTGTEWDPEGPEPWRCECGDLAQYIGEGPGEHCCIYIHSESEAAARFEDAAHGDDREWF